MATIAIEHPQGFRPRRGLNWIALGLCYASFYLCRYNISFAMPSISSHFNYTYTQIGIISTAMFWAYAIGQFVNGLLADKLGGRLAMAIGGFGTVVINMIFGFGSFVGVLGYFIVIWALNGYIQSFGAPGMVKTNTAWFAPTERGKFAGIFGLMIQIGLFVLPYITAPVLSNYPWHWLFWLPAIITFFVTMFMFIVARNSPEEAGYPPIKEFGVHDADKDQEVTFRWLFKKVFIQKAIWIFAGAYFVTGVARYGILYWFPTYMQNVQGYDLGSAQFQIIYTMLPLTAVAGSYLSGWISDVFFDAKRAPVAGVLYFLQVLLFVIAYFLTNATLIILMIILLQFMVNGTHSIVGSSAAMDFGGKKAAGFASGVIDSFQYIGAGLSQIGVGALIDAFGWDVWFISLSAFGLLGGFLMVAIWNDKPADS